MTQKKPKAYGYIHIKQTKKKRQGRHSKHKKIKRYRGQGR